MVWPRVPISRFFYLLNWAVILVTIMSCADFFFNPEGKNPEKWHLFIFDKTLMELRVGMHFLALAWKEQLEVRVAHNLG